MALKSLVCKDGNYGQVVNIKRFWLLNRGSSDTTLSYVNQHVVYTPNLCNYNF
jgi:hypothetical protein